MGTVAEQDAAAKAELDIATAKKGVQSITVSANVDPTAYVQFKVREDLINHFDIKPFAPSITATDIVFVAKRKAVAAGTGTKPVTVVSANAGTVKPSDSKIIGRAIKIPTSGGYTRKIKGTQKPINEVTVRVPSNMSLTAICLWINSAFTQASKKPTYFRTPAGARVMINSGFNDKTKLANKKNE